MRSRALLVSHQPALAFDELDYPVEFILPSLVHPRSMVMKSSIPDLQCIFLHEHWHLS